jgi:porphobilinogen deaminase
VVAAFGGDCTLPLAAWARWERLERPASGEGHAAPSDRRELRLSALLATPDGRHAARGEAAGSEPETVAAACIAALRADGADEVLARVREERRR